MTKVKSNLLKTSSLLVIVTFLFSCSNTKKTEFVQEGTTQQIATDPFKEGNPIIKDKYTADPAAFVYKDTVYLYAGQDVCPPSRNFYEMNDWLIYTSTDMVNWEEKASFPVSAFKWARGDAWAAHVIEKNGKFYWFVTVTHATKPGKAIGVAVADHPLGPWKDAIGEALITNDMTPAPFQISDGQGGKRDMDWDDIDPALFTDDDGQTYVFWGNTQCHYAKLKDNMIELDGPIIKIELPNYTEAPWVHKKGDWYYLSYAYQFPEKTAYAMSKSIDGPWEFKGILNELAGNCNTNHQAIIEYKGKDYFIYHNGGIQTEGMSFRRSVCIDYLYYNPDGSLKKVVMTTEGVNPVE